MKRLFLSFMVVGMLFTSGCLPLWIIPVSSACFFVRNIHCGIKDAEKDREAERLKNDIPKKEIKIEELNAPSNR